MDSQREMVSASLNRDNQRDVTPIRLKRHPAYVSPAAQQGVMHPSDVRVIRDFAGRITGYVYDPGGEVA